MVNSFDKLFQHGKLQAAIKCLKLAKETLEHMKYSMYNVNDVDLVSLLWTLNIFYILL